MKLQIRLFLFLLVIFLIGLLTSCFSASTTDFQKDRVFEGTVLELLEDENMIVVSEYLNSSEENINRKIPVSNLDQYHKGQKLKITVYTNISADIWDLEHMRFDIEPVNN